jgi:hypothetical protein
MPIFLNCILTTLRENCFRFGWRDQPVVQRRILAIETKNSILTVRLLRNTNEYFVKTESNRVLSVKMQCHTGFLLSPLSPEF